MMNDNDRPVANPAFTAEVFDDEILLYSAAGAQAVYLNNAAHAVWRLCQENLTVGQIINYLEQAFPEQKEQIRPDVMAALELLLANTVIELIDGE
jgi:hypothetical protein